MKIISMRCVLADHPIAVEEFSPIEIRIESFSCGNTSYIPVHLHYRTSEMCISHACVPDQCPGMEACKISLCLILPV